MPEPLHVRVSLKPASDGRTRRPLRPKLILASHHVARKAAAGEILIPDPAASTARDNDYLYADRGVTTPKDFEDPSA